MPTGHAGDDGEESDGQDAPPQTQYEIMRDAGFRHLENEELDDQRATQRIQSRPSRLGHNRPAENGIIENIECINFMCHERLYVELGPLINFIVGENGSGKSAVLTALTLCLGGKASSTNRGGSLKSFIKEGRDQSVISVTIKNTGIDAYQSDVYGASIKVERHFTRSGASGFKLKSEQGRIISTKKTDIDEITEYWGLQVDNPLNVLSQDNARQFLNAATPAQKYKFFFKGVQLEQLDHDYRYVSETLDSHEAKLPEVRDRVHRAEVDFKKAQQDKQLADQHQGMRERLSRLRGKLVWCQVVEEERELATRQAGLARAESMQVEAARQLAQVTEQLDHDDLMCQEVRATVAERTDAKDAQSAAVDEANALFEENKKNLTTLHRQERDLHEQTKAADDALKRITKEIEAEKATIREGAGLARQQVLDKIAAAEEKEANISTRMSDEVEATPRFKAETAEASEKANIAKKDLGKQEDDIRGLENHIRVLKSESSLALNPKIERLRKAIQNDGRFETRPLGPIGSYIQLLKPEWSSIIEATFGQILNSFLVSNKNDQQLLAQHMRTLGVSGTGIVIGRRLAANTKFSEPDGRFLTILRALKINDDWVRDQLVINFSIEKIILVKTRDEGQEIMFPSSGGPPRDVIACLVPHDRKRGDGLRLTNRGGGPSTSPVQGWTKQPRMQSDAQFQVAYQEETLRGLRQALQQASRHAGDLESEARRCYEAQKRHEAAIPQMERSLRKTQAEILELKEKLDSFEGVDDRLAVLQQSRKDAEDDKFHLGTQYGETKVNVQASNKTSEASKAALAEEKLKLREAEAQLTKAELKLKRASDARNITLMKKQRAIDQQQAAIDGRNAAERRYLEQQADVAKLVEQAEALCHRVPVQEDETYSSIDKQYTNLRNHIKDREKHIGMSDDEITRRLTETHKAHKYWTEFHEAQTDLHRAGKKSLQDRIIKWRCFQAHISAHSRMNFQYLLSERGFRGQLRFEHPKKILTLSVEPDETRRSAAGRSTKTLSGGEKSFSSICMLLAIWEAMGSPLRCLDEFDVFMDNVNRTVSTNMLVSFSPFVGISITWLTQSDRSMRRATRWASNTL
jgi:structural maintenance of chromosomes protein 6